MALLRADRWRSHALRCAIGIIAMLGSFWAFAELPLAQAWVHAATRSLNANLGQWTQLDARLKLHARRNRRFLNRTEITVMLKTLSFVCLLAASGASQAATVHTGRVASVDFGPDYADVRIDSVEYSGGTQPSCHTGPADAYIVQDTGYGEYPFSAALAAAASTGARVSVWGKDSCFNGIQYLYKIKVYSN
jgi:hypothetical protein